MRSNPNTKYYTRRLAVERELSGHEGCVNNAAFNADGTLLVTGSDDLHLNVYNVHSWELLKRLRTQHRGNIFGCAFLGEDSLISCCHTGTVQYHPQIDEQFTQMFRCHQELCTSVLADSMNSAQKVFLSCSFDGTVNQYDTRVRTSCECEHHCNRHTLVDINVVTEQKYCPGCSRFILPPCKSRCGVAGSPMHSHDHHHHNPNHVGINSMDIDQTRPWLLAVGCSDNFVRVFDRRKMLTPCYEVSNGLIQDDSVCAHVTQEEEQEENDNQATHPTHFPHSITCYNGLTYAFCPSNLRSVLQDRLSGIEIDLSGEGMEEGDTDNYGESDFESEDDEFISEDLQLSMRRNFDHPTSFYAQPEQQRIQQSIIEQIEMPPSDAESDSDGVPEDVGGVCGLKWDQGGRLLNSYQNGDIVVIEPSCMLHSQHTWSRYEDGFAQFGSGLFKQMKNEYRQFYKQYPGEQYPAMVYPLFKREFADIYDKDILGRYAGHKNEETMLKQPCWFPVYGSADQSAAGAIMSGSDNGHLFIWQTNFVKNPLKRMTDRLKIQKPQFLVQADAYIVNCVVAHPTVPMIVASGIDNSAKVLTPFGGMAYEAAYDRRNVVKKSWTKGNNLVRCTRSRTEKMNRVAAQQHNKKLKKVSQDMVQRRMRQIAVNGVFDFALPAVMLGDDSNSDSEMQLAEGVQHMLHQMMEHATPEQMSQFFADNNMTLPQGIASLHTGRVEGDDNDSDVSSSWSLSSNEFFLNSRHRSHPRTGLAASEQSTTSSVRPTVNTNQGVINNNSSQATSTERNVSQQQPALNAQLQTAAMASASERPAEFTAGSLILTSHPSGQRHIATAVSQISRNDYVETLPSQSHNISDVHGQQTPQIQISQSDASSAPAIGSAAQFRGPSSAVSSNRSTLARGAQQNVTSRRNHGRAVNFINGNAPRHLSANRAAPAVSSPNNNSTEPAISDSEPAVTITSSLIQNNQNSNTHTGQIAPIQTRSQSSAQQFANPVNTQNRPPAQGSFESNIRGMFL